MKQPPHRETKSNNRQADIIKRGHINNKHKPTIPLIKTIISNTIKKELGAYYKRKSKTKCSTLLQNTKLISHLPQMTSHSSDYTGIHKTSSKLQAVIH
jgi:hypothetical protein